MENKNFFCAVTGSEMGYDEDIFLYFSIMKELASLISQIKDLDKEYKDYDTLIKIAYNLPDSGYDNIGIISNLEDFNPDNSYWADEI